MNTIRQLLQYNRRGRFDRHFATPKPQNVLMLPWPKDFIYVFEKPKVTFGGATCITRVSGDYVSFDVKDFTKAVDASGRLLKDIRQIGQAGHLFVLQPLADIRPNLILPGQKKTTSELLAELKASGEVVRFGEEW